MTDSQESMKLAYYHWLRLTGRLTLAAIAISMAMFMALFYAPYIFDSYTWIISFVVGVLWVIVAVVGFIVVFKMLPLARRSRKKE